MVAITLQAGAFSRFLISSIDDDTFDSYPSQVLIAAMLHDWRVSLKLPRGFIKRFEDVYCVEPFNTWHISAPPFPGVAADQNPTESDNRTFKRKHAVGGPKGMNELLWALMAREIESCALPVRRGTRSLETTRMSTDKWMILWERRHYLSQVLSSSALWLISNQSRQI